MALQDCAICPNTFDDAGERGKVRSDAGRMCCSPECTMMLNRSWAAHERGDINMSLNEYVWSPNPNDPRPEWVVRSFTNPNVSRPL